jgi:hypothetical protein
VVSEPELIQGRQIGEVELEHIRGLVADHPRWSRRKISVALCEHFGWRSGTGQLRDMSARLLLNKLEERGMIKLPAKMASGGARVLKVLSQPGLFDTLELSPSIEEPLRDLQPLEVLAVPARSQEHTAFVCHLQRHHYLGYGGGAGQNLRYLIRDNRGRDLACALFSAAAWKLKPRDSFIGWSAQQRTARLGLIANNSRFLIMPHVRVTHLASHVLGLLLRRLPKDWMLKYGCKPVLAESFVERDRFEGICYRASNWRCVGQTAARGRNDRYHKEQAPVKDVLLYPLAANFREVLCA